MTYEIFINSSPFLSGDLYLFTAIALAIVILVAIIIRMTWNKFKTYEALKYEFVTIIAHKFRTPLSQIKWLLESAIEDEKDSFKKENLVTIRSSNETLINLTGTLIELSDATQGALATYHVERINICELVRKVSNDLTTRFHQNNLFMGLTFSDPEIFIKADITRIEFVLQTIMENSINYSYTGKDVDILVKKQGSKVLISVIDQGIGIDPADKPFLFTKFFRSDSARRLDTEGFGVGLYLANSIVKRHSGKMKMVSEGLDKGTTVTLILPRVK